MVLLGSWCGLRLGEFLALTRGDVDLLNGHVHVTKSAAELKSGERVIGSPKTAAGIRRVAIPPHVLPAIEAHIGNVHRSENCRPRVRGDPRVRLSVELRSIQPG